MSFAARITGVRASCTKLDPCSNCPSTCSCGVDGYPLPYVAEKPVPIPPKNYVLGLWDDYSVVGGLIQPWEHATNGSAPHNPSTTLVQLYWMSKQFSMNPGDGTVTGSVTWLVTACSLEMFNGTLKYTRNPLASTAAAAAGTSIAPAEGSYELLPQTVVPSLREYHGVLWGASMRQLITSRLAVNMEVVALADHSSDSDKIALLNQELARLTLGFNAGLFQRAPATDAKRLKPTLVGRYPLPALLAYVGILYTYAALAFFVFATSAFSSSYVIKVPASLSQGKDPVLLSSLELAEAWLTNSLTLVSALFPSEERRHADYKKKFSVTGTTENLNMFVDTPDTEKTHLGLGPPGSNNPRYGVWRRKSSREAYASADSLPGESSMVERYFD